jgi:hypothetical protein
MTNNERKTGIIKKKYWEKNKRIIRNSNAYSQTDVINMQRCAFNGADIAKKN